MNAPAALVRISKWIFIASGIWMIGLGGYFMFARPPLLPEDLRYLGSNAIQVAALSPHLASWLRNVFTVMGGFMAGCGILTIFAGMRAVPQALNGTGIALGCTGLLTVATMGWTNFVLDSDFPWASDFTLMLVVIGAVAASAGILSPILTYWISSKAGSAQGWELGKQTAAASLGVTLGSAAGGLLFNFAALPGASFVLTAGLTVLGLALSLGLPQLLVRANSSPRAVPA